MIISGSKLLILKGDGKIEENSKILTVKQDKEIVLDIQIVTETRIRKNNDSTNVLSSSREIKKWFESRRI